MIFVNQTILNPALKSKETISFGISIINMYFIQLFHYSFIQNALVAGCFIGLACSLLGVFLVLRNVASMGDGISHISFGSIALSLYLGIYPIYIAAPIAIITSLAILNLNKKARIYGDAAISIISSLGISGGVIFASLSQGFNVNLFSYLFGNILAITGAELYTSIILCLTVVAAIGFLYWDMFSATFDEEYARTTGIKTDSMSMLLTILSAITIVLSIKIVGVMLVSALLIIPASAALQVCKRLEHTLLMSCLFSIISILLGLLLSLCMDLPAGATIVIVSILVFCFAVLYRIFFKH